MKLVSVLLVAVLTIVAIGAVSATPVNVHGKWYDRIVLVLFENEPYSKVISDPNFLKYARSGRTLTNFYAVAHPSQPNYIALIAGDVMGVTGDGVFNIAGTNVVDLFNKVGVTWKSYQESYPGHCFARDSGKYRRKHNPFMSFNSIRNNATACANIVDASVFDQDLANNTLPNFSFYTPNMDNDGHDTGVTYAGNYFNNWMKSRLPKLMQPGTLTIITYDEDDYSENNHIYTVLLSSSITPGSQDTTSYNHFSILKTIEDNWGVGNLGRHDATATPIMMP